MTFQRVMLICTFWMFATATAVSQGSYPAAIKKAKPTLARIELIILDINALNSSQLPSDIAKYRANFTDGKFIAGTGFVINDSGDIVTAAHVAQLIKIWNEELRNAAIQAICFASFPGEPIEDSSGSVPSDSVGVSFNFRMIDLEHDVAVINAPDAPRVTASFNGMKTVQRRVPAKFDPNGLVEGQDVFLAGFPMGSSDAVFTSGTVASVDAYEPLVTAKAAGFGGPQKVYKLDVRASHGNSGGPVFSRSSDGVVGMLIEGIDGGGYTVALPSKLIAEVLTKNGVSWLAVSAAKHEGSATARRKTPH